MKVNEYFEQHRSQLLNIITDEILDPVPSLVAYIRNTSEGFNDEDIFTIVELTAELGIIIH